MLRSDYLISPTFSLESLLVAGTNKTFDVYFHQSGSPIEVSRNTNLAQVIQPLPFSNNLLAYARDQLLDISRYVDVLFHEVYTPFEADISIYFDSTIDDSDPNSDTYGLTLFHLSLTHI